MAESEVLQSRALYLGPLEVVERPSRSRRRMRGNVAKLWLTRLLAPASQRLPPRLQIALLRLLTVPIQLSAGLPGNQLLVSCRALAELAERAGYRHHPRGMYRAFVDGARSVLEWGAYATRGSAERTAEHIVIPRADLLRELVRENRGCMLCVPHNTGAVLASLKLSRLVPTLLLAKNPNSIARTRIALAAYERLGVQVLLVRAGNRFELGRACLRALRDGKVLVATVDRIDRKRGRVLAPFFGGVASLAPWASRIAAKSGVPVVPTYAHTRRDRVVVEWGEPMQSRDPDELLRHYLGFIERRILADPSSWSFLADRRWRWVLQDALAGTRRTDGGVHRPSRAQRLRIWPGRVLEPGSPMKRAIHLRS